MQKISAFIAALATLFVVSQASALSPPQTFSMSNSSAITSNFSGFQATLSSVAPPVASPDGGNAAKVLRSSGSVFTIDTFSTLFPAFPYTYSCVSAYVRAGSASSVGKTSRLFARERTPAGALVGQNSTSVTLSNSWQQVFAYRTMTGAGTNYMDFYVDLTDSTAGSYFFVDGMHVDGGIVPDPPGSC